MKVRILLVLILCFVSVSKAQTPSGHTELSGRVIDQLGAAIDSVRIVLVNDDGVSFQTISNADGKYSIRLPAGMYTLLAEHTGHNGWEKFTIQKFGVAEIARMALDICLTVNPVVERTELIGTSPREHPATTSSALLAGSEPKTVIGGWRNSQAVDFPQPGYPPELSGKKRLKAVVDVKILIGTDGRVETAEAFRGPKEFYDAAVQAALMARFQPFTLEGKPAKVSAWVSYTFSP